MVVCLRLPTFAAALEERDDPRLEGRPLLVVEDGPSTPLVYGASSDALRRGVKVGMPLRQAQTLCPPAQPVIAHPARYERARAEFLETLAAFSPRVERYTPTRVGKTPSVPWRALVIQVHPHACGENSMGNVFPAAFSGTPPRVWGKRILLFRLGAVQRYTPTRVGKTVQPVSVMAIRTGTPPRVWGKRRLTALAKRKGRYTPTRVGKTRPVQVITSFSIGTPPRVWGKPSSAGWLVIQSRYTPTRVGKTRIEHEEPD